MTDDTTVQTRRRGPRGAFTALAFLLALLALAVAGACAWRMWQWNRAQVSQTALANELASRLGTAERQAENERAQRQTLQHQLDEMQADLRATRDSQNALDQRTRNLETAIGQISNQQFQGRDALLLDDAEFLLRAAQQRWVLMRDADAAARAYSLADDALAQVSDQAYQPVRVSLATERVALAANAAPSRMQTLDALASMRAQAMNLPLAGSEPPVRAPGTGMLARAWRALSGVLQVERDDGTSTPAADARVAREMFALDCAQAQAASMAFDETGFRAAVQRADELLAARFDPDASEVRSARSQLQAMSNAHTATSAPQLGGALAQLRALRASHAMQTIAPAPATRAARP